MKEQKGITLIALVITIIVLLILAGVSIAMLGGSNGILTQANNAKNETAKSEAIEKINLTLSAVKSTIYEQQVAKSNYSAIATDGNSPETAIITALTTDGIVDTEAEGVYWYEFDKTTGDLTISYKNTTKKVPTVSGKVNLKTAPYTINEAPQNN